MEIILYIGWFITFIALIYFIIQVTRDKQPIWRMWVCLAVLWAFAIGIFLN